MDANRIELFHEENALDLKVVIALNRLNNDINRRANIIFLKHGLTTMQFAVLEVLYHKGDLKIGQIIEKILSTGGNMTVVINNLAKEDMIKKTTDPSDCRASIISITEKGCDIMRAVFPEYVEDLRLYLRKLSDEEKQLITNIGIKMSI